MEVIEVLQNASRQVYQNVKGLAGTKAAAGDNGIGAGGDVSRNIDIIAEKAVLDYLKKVGFECVVLGEECGRVELSDNPKGFVIMDAIDGSANAVRGIPFFCCSLAFAAHDQLSSVTDGVITDLSTGQMYWATKGKGCFFDGKQVRVDGAADAKGEIANKSIYKIVGVNTSGASRELMAKLQPIFENYNHVRHFGANALEMALFARGLVDVFIDLRKKIRIQDLAAGYILVKEAGGVILDENYAELDSDLSYEARLSFMIAASREEIDDVWQKKC